LRSGSRNKEAARQKNRRQKLKGRKPTEGSRNQKEEVERWKPGGKSGVPQE
jgi:hypothetical protein